MNNIIKGIKLILSGLFSPFKTIANNMYMYVGKKYYWAPILVKIEQLEKVNKRLELRVKGLELKFVEYLKESIKGGK